ncbi:MAG: hypothetical protein HQL83_09910 [Magnetococcales bacterium]|nr:hypothetical protein [Magnetococcales bacterium]
MTSLNNQVDRRHQHALVTEPMKMYGRHPSDELLSIYSNKPFQGQDPNLAKIIFLSLDANYSPQISDHPFFSNIIDYHKDSVSFWQKNKNKVHHPFLLGDYPFNKTKDGVPFHRNFSKLNLSPEYAPHISFVELLNVPTIGKTQSNTFKQLLYTDENIERLRALESVLLHGKSKFLFVSNKVIQKLHLLKKSHGLFEWITEKPSRQGSNCPSLIFESNSLLLFYTHHFSASGIHAQLPAIEQIIKQAIQLP